MNSTLKDRYSLCSFQEIKMNSTLTTVPPTLDFPPSPVLAHTRNTRGDLGMFVNPYICPCSTCREVVAEEAETRPQSTGTLEASDSESEGFRRRATGYYDVPPECEELRPTATTHFGTPTIPPGPPLVRVNAFTDSLGREGYRVSLNPLADLLREQSALPGSTEANIMSQLGALRLRLKAEMEELDNEPCRSHDEMAAVDIQWEDLDTKINAIEEVLTAFGIAFEE